MTGTTVVLTIQVLSTVQLTLTMGVCISSRQLITIDVLCCRPCVGQTSLRFYGRDGSQPPVMPKKPQSSYMAFYNEKRSSIMDAHPGTSVGWEAT